MEKFVKSCFCSLSEGKDSYPHIIILLKIVEEQLFSFKKDEGRFISETLINDVIRSASDDS